MWSNYFASGITLHYNHSNQQLCSGGLCVLCCCGNGRPLTGQISFIPFLPFSFACCEQNSDLDTHADTDTHYMLLHFCTCAVCSVIGTIFLQCSPPVNWRHVKNQPLSLPGYVETDIGNTYMLPLFVTYSDTHWQNVFSVLSNRTIRLQRV